MEYEFTERRHSPRVAVDNESIVALHVSVPVRLLNLTSEGLLLACAVSLRIGSTVRGVTELAGRRLEVELCVDQVSNRPDEGIGGYDLDGRIQSFAPTARGMIVALLGARAPGTTGGPPCGTSSGLASRSGCGCS